MVAFSQMSVNPSLIATMPHDPLRDFAHIGIFWRGPQLLAASAAVPASTLIEVLAAAKARPGQLRYGSAGNGSPGHLFMEQLKLAAKVDVEHIPYKGSAVVVAGISGEVDLLMDGVSPQLPHIRAGKLKPLAVAGTQRLGVLPDVPTFEAVSYTHLDVYKRQRRPRRRSAVVPPQRRPQAQASGQEARAD